MAKIVNLRATRKARERTEKAVRADANRALHGRTLEQRQADTSTRAALDRTLDGAKREK